MKCKFWNVRILNLKKKKLGCVCCWLLRVELWVSLAVVFLWRAFFTECGVTECVIHPEVTPCGWRNVKIEELINCLPYSGIQIHSSSPPLCPPQRVCKSDLMHCSKLICLLRHWQNKNSKNKQQQKIATTNMQNHNKRTKRKQRTKIRSLKPFH